MRRMTLREYFDKQRKKPDGLTVSKLAEKLGISVGHASDLINGNVNCSLAIAVQIEELTGNKVRCRDLLVETAAAR